MTKASDAAGPTLVASGDSGAVGAGGALDAALARWVARAARPNWSAGQRNALLARLGWNVPEALTLDRAGRQIGVTRERLRQLQRHLETSLAGHAGPTAQIAAALKVLADACPLPADSASELLVARGITRKRIDVAGLLHGARLVGLRSPIVLSRQRWVHRTGADQAVTGRILRRLRAALAQAGVAGEDQLLAGFPARERQHVRRFLPAILGSVDWARQLPGTASWCAWEDGRPAPHVRFLQLVRRALSVCGPLPADELLAGVRRAHQLNRGVRRPLSAETLLRVCAMDPDLRVAGGMVHPAKPLDPAEVVPGVQFSLIELIRDIQRITGEEHVPLFMIAELAKDCGTPAPSVYLNVKWAPFLFDVRRGLIGVRKAGTASTDVRG